MTRAVGVSSSLTTSGQIWKVARVLSRIYIDNFKCFVNFECVIDSFQLLLGENGSGKTALFDLLESLGSFVTAGPTAIVAFPSSSLTAWDKRSHQTFELDLAGNGGTYRYHLVIEHDRKNARNHIQTEELRFNQQLLYHLDGSDAHLFLDDGTAGAVFPFEPSRSGLPFVPDRFDTKLLSWFRRRIERIFVLAPDPLRMSSHSESESPRPDRRLENLASWLRHLSQESLDSLVKVKESLKAGVISGLTNFKLERAGESTRVLKFEFQFAKALEGPSPKPFSLSFEDLSDGQRNLVALFAMLHGAVDSDSTLCIDEPDNFVALREIQPWLIELTERVEDRKAQCLLISHNPEIINYLAPAQGLRFFREETGPVRTERFSWSKDEMLLPAEIVVRGWE